MEGASLMIYRANILIFIFFVLTPLTATSQVTITNSGKTMPIVKLAIHGGAGDKPHQLKDPKKREAYKAVLKEAFDKAYQKLKNGGTSEEAVITAIMILEDSELFNAGRGSVLNAEADVSMDAAIMLGENKQVGSVIGTKRTQNPILLAQTIMKNSVHNTLQGKGADEFAKLNKLSMKPLSYFETPERIEQLKNAKKQNQVLLDHSGPKDPEKFGTVGAVALDQYGHLAAGTSTGGLANKTLGRVGDSPIIGAGTFADDATCAISATGKGEEFIRHTVAGQIHFDMLYNQSKLTDAVNAAVHKTLDNNTGGIIAISKAGEVVLDFNTRIMFRAYVDEKGEVHVQI